MAHKNISNFLILSTGNDDVVSTPRTQFQHQYHSLHWEPNTNPAPVPALRPNTKAHSAHPTPGGTSRTNIREDKTNNTEKLSFGSCRARAEALSRDNVPAVCKRTDDSRAVTVGETHSSWSALANEVQMITQSTGKRAERWLRRMRGARGAPSWAAWEGPGAP